MGGNVETPPPSNRPPIIAAKNCKIVRHLRRCSGLALVGGCPRPLALAPSLSEAGRRLDNLSFGREDEKHGEKRFVPETASSQLVRPPAPDWLRLTDGGAPMDAVHPYIQERDKAAAVGSIGLSNEHPTISSPRLASSRPPPPLLPSS